MLSFFKSDTGSSFGLEDANANHERVVELMARNPFLLAEDERHRLFHCPHAAPACFFRLELKEQLISYYAPYETIEMPRFGKAVAACSWASLLYGIGTASKDRVFFRALPAIADVIVSSVCLPSEGIRFWLDVLAQARREGFVTGIIQEAGRIIEHKSDIGFDDQWVEEIALIQESLTVGDLRFFYAKP